MGTSENEGEGNKSADRNYRKATKEFVESERGKRAIENAGNVSPSEEKDIRRAEEQAKQHAKDHDPAELDVTKHEGTSTEGLSRNSRPAR